MKPANTSFSFLNNKKLIFVLPLFLLLAGSIVFSVMFFSSRHTLHDKTVSQIGKTTDDLINQINLNFEKNTIEVKYIALSTSIVYPLQLKIYPQLRQFCESILSYSSEGKESELSYTNIKSLVILDSSGRVIFSSSPLLKQDSSSGIKIEKQHYSGYIPSDDDINIYTYYPIIKNDKVIGAVLSIYIILDYSNLVMQKLHNTELDAEFELSCTLNDKPIFIINSKKTVRKPFSADLQYAAKQAIKQEAYLSTVGKELITSIRGADTRTAKGIITVYITDKEYSRLLSRSRLNVFITSAGITFLFAILAVILLLILQAGMYRNIRNHLQIDNLRSQKHEFLKHINIINGLISYNKIDVLKKYLQSVSNNMVFYEDEELVDNPAILVLIRQKKHECMEKRIDFRFRCNTPLADTTIEDYDMCTILGNLIDNAMEASLRIPDDRIVSVEISFQTGIYVFTISNKGPGIKKKHMPKIFNYRYSTKKDLKSHGMGLFLVKRTARKYKGSIEVKSSDGITTFTVYLPERL